jgi:hypothetical protein
MYKIEQHLYGFRMVFAGHVDQVEMSAWLRDSERHLLRQTGDFGVFVDLRNLKPLAADARAVLHQGQKRFRTKGMTRSVVVLNNPVVTQRLRRRAKKTGIDQLERYLDASKTPEWEVKGLAWLTAGTDPDA